MGNIKDALAKNRRITQKAEKVAKNSGKKSLYADFHLLSSHINVRIFCDRKNMIMTQTRDVLLSFIRFFCRQKSNMAAVFAACPSARKELKK